ncbi:MAG: 50S ribosomal protein L10 [Burkholderiales bacterium]|nr:50S ribosomal protein L10 [Burkholderiales bacterium]
MSSNLENKKTVVADVNKVLQDAATVVIAQYQGVTVSRMTAIRKEARQKNVYLHVLKNTLARKAVEGTVFAPLAEKMSGPLVYSVSTDPIAAAKVIDEFAKANEAVKIVGGMFNDKLLDESGVKQLASIPGREELLSMLLGTMLQIPASFVRVVAAVRDQKEQAA